MVPQSPHSSSASTLAVLATFYDSASQESKGGRIKKKTTARSNWFRRRKKTTPGSKGQTKVENTDDAGTRKNHGYTTMNQKVGDHPDTTKEDNMRIAAVMFVENTKEGGLAKNLREVVERIKGILGYKIKIVERAGTALKQMFPLTKIGQGGVCGKEDCVTCTQEKIYRPVTRGVLCMKISV